MLVALSVVGFADILGSHTIGGLYPPRHGPKELSCTVVDVTSILVATRKASWTSCQ